MFVGETGVGKTALAEGLALRIREGHVPEDLRSAELLLPRSRRAARGRALSAGFRSALQGADRGAARAPSPILFIDEVHTILGAGAAQVDASNLLKPLLFGVSGNLRCIGTTTYEEYKNYFEKDRALSRRFQKIEISEPSVDETIEILKGLNPATKSTTMLSTRRRPSRRQQSFQPSISPTAICRTRPLT